MQFLYADVHKVTALQHAFKYNFDLPDSFFLDIIMYRVSKVQIIFVQYENSR